MTKVKYEIEITGLKNEESNSKTIQAQEEKKVTQAKTNDEVVQNNLVKKASVAIGIAATIYSVGQTIAQPMIKQAINEAAIKGDFVQAKSIQRTSELIDKAVNTGFQAGSIALAYAVNPVLGIGATVSTLYSYGKQAYDRQQQNMFTRKQNEINNYLNSYSSARFVELVGRG